MLSKDGIAIIFSDCVVQRLYLVRDRDGRMKYDLTSGNYLHGIYHGYKIIIHANNKYEFKMKCDLMGLDIKFFEYKIKRSEIGNGLVLLLMLTFQQTIDIILVMKVTKFII